MSTPALLPSATPTSFLKWAVGSVILVVFALVVLQALGQRGYDPVGAIARMLPQGSPAPSPVVGTGANSNSAAALA